MPRRSRPSHGRFWIMGSLLAALSLVFAACTDSADTTTTTEPPPTTVAPTPTTAPPPTTTAPAPTTTSTTEPEPEVEEEVVVPEIQVEISMDVPADIPGGAPGASFQDAAVFAWQEFIALNWPASARDVPDSQSLFGQPNASTTLYNQPTVWESFRHKVEIFTGDTAPNGYVDDAAQDYGYDADPSYFYTKIPGGVPACPGQDAVSSPAWVNLDEVSQINLDDMFAGVLPHQPASNGESGNIDALIRFLAKGNKTEYVYVAENNLWGPQAPNNPAASQTNNWVDNFTETLFQITNPSNPKPAKLANQTVPTDEIIYFPPGTIEVKTAFRPLTDAESQSGRFHTTTVRFYETNESGAACYLEDEWGLLALHIIHKTPTAPYFIFATFEQADNIQTTMGQPVEDVTGANVNAPSGPPTVPDVSFTDGITLAGNGAQTDGQTDPPKGSFLAPYVALADGSFCPNDTDDKRLYYSNIVSNPAIPSTGDKDGNELAIGSNICVQYRRNPIPETVQQVNGAAQAAIQQYNADNGITGSPWEYYKLVNVQWQPFDKSAIDTSNLESDTNQSTFYLSNSVVETNLTLSMFSGRLDNGAFSDWDNPGTGVTTSTPTGSPTTPAETFWNVYTFPDATFDPSTNKYSGGTTVSAVNMGGCMGCHGNAQIGGFDFSFIAFGAKFPASSPEHPGMPPADRSNAYPELTGRTETLGTSGDG